MTAASHQTTPAVIIASAALLSFAPALANRFALDDYPHLVENSQAHSIATALGSFFSPFFPGNLYRPAVTLSYAITHAFFGLEPWPYHLTNILLHALCAGLLLKLLCRLIPPSSAFIAALLFAVHPLHSEAAANVANRSELLCHSAGLAAAVLVLGAVGNETLASRISLGRMAAAALCLAVSFFSKESGLAWLLIVPLCLYFAGASRELRRGAVIFTLAAPTALYFIFRLAAFAGRIFPGNAISLIDNPLASAAPALRVMNALALLGDYLVLCVLPFNLSADYSLAQLEVAHNLLSPDFILRLVPVAALAAAGLAGFGRKQSESLGAVWFFAGFVVTSNVIFPIGTIFAERLAYLPSAGICVLLALGLSRLRSLPIRLSVIVVLTAAFGLKSLVHTSVWRDNESLHSYQIQASPRSAPTLLNYAFVLRNRGELELAENLIKQALTIAPDSGDAAFGLATVYLARSKTGEAQWWLRRSIELAPEHLHALNTLGRLELARGNTREADLLFHRMQQIDNNNLEARIGRLAVMINQKNYGPAFELRAELINEHPDHPEIKMLNQRLDQIQPTGAR